MRVVRLSGLFALAIAFLPDANSLEQSGTVKATTVLKTDKTWDGNAIRYPDGEAEISGLVVEIAPGGETGWHLHPVPSFALVLEGELEVLLKNGAVKRVKSGEALAEVVDTLHNGRNVGTVPVKLVVFYAGSVGQGLTVEADAQQPDYEAMIALRSSGGFQAALDAATKQLAADANDGIAAGVRAFVYANAVDFLGMPNAQAREIKQSALADALRLSTSGSWTRAAFALIHMFEDSQRAERELAACIVAAPDFLECRNLYGDLLRKQDRLEEAGNAYQRALDRWPDDGELIVSYALLLQQAGQTGAALEKLAKLTRDQPDFARGHWHLAAMLYESGGDRTIALREAREALALDPLIWNGKRLLDALDVQQ